MTYNSNGQKYNKTNEELGTLHDELTLQDHKITKYYDETDITKAS